MKKPSLSINGTSAKSLLDGYLEARKALRVATNVLRDTWPHARDYPQEDWPVAVAEHEDRLRRLASVYKELGDLMEHCAGR